MTNKELISKKEIIEILKKEVKFNQENDLNGEYGKGVLFALQSFTKYINSLPTFSPETIIKEIIKNLKGLQPENGKLTKKDILQKTLSKIHTKNIS